MELGGLYIKGLLLQWGHGWVAVEDASAAAPVVDDVMLQWGHGWVAVEDFDGSGKGAAKLKLQWGHGSVAVEDLGQLDRRGGRDLASMGPRLGSRGRPRPGL